MKIKEMIFKHKKIIEDYKLFPNLNEDKSLGFDDIKPFQIFTMKFHPLNDENTTFELFDDAEIKRKKENIIKNYVIVPAIIIKEKNNEYGGPIVYDILIWNRWNGCGEISGYLEMVGVPVWRYFANEIPPKWFLKMITNCKKNDNDVVCKNKHKTFFYNEKNEKVSFPFNKYLKDYKPNF
jgi:hypothetical protein